MIHPVWPALHARHATGAPGSGFAPGAVIGLIAMGIASFMVATDFTTLGVILPKIEAQFDAEVSTAQWVINAYTLVFGMLVIAGGRLADLFGRRRVFFTGMTIFGISSLLAGAASGVFWLIGARVLMGIGGAMIWPPVFSISYALVSKEKAALAGGIILGALGLGCAAGPLIGGALAEFASWRWVLFINAPVAAVVWVLAWFKVRIARPPKRRERIDYAGMTTLSFSLLSLLVALDQASDWGFRDPRIIALFAIAVILLAVFVVIERRAGDTALIPVPVLRDRTMSSALASRILIAGSFFVALVYIPEYMEKILGYSPFEAGLGMLPMMLGYAAVSFVSGPLYPRWGAKFMGSGGIALMVLGCGVFMLVIAHAGYVQLVPGLLLVGVGYAFCATALNTAGVLALPAEHASLAGAILYMGQLVGGSIGLGAYTTVLTIVSDARIRVAGLAAGLTSDQLGAVGRFLGGTESGRALFAGFPQSAGALEKLARDAFAHGMHAGFVMLIAFGLLSMLVALRYLGEWRSPRGDSASLTPDASPAAPVHLSGKTREDGT